jgi:hypothetical protein
MGMGAALWLVMTIWFLFALLALAVITLPLIVTTLLRLM